MRSQTKGTRRQASFPRDGKALHVSAAQGVLSNDYDPLGQTLTVSAYTQPAVGFEGIDSFIYTVTSGSATATADVDIEVTDPAPLPSDAKFSLLLGSSNTVRATGSGSG